MERERESRTPGSLCSGRNRSRERAEEPVKRHRRTLCTLIALTATALACIIPVASQAQESPAPTPGTPPNQLASVTLAQGIKAVPLFGQGSVTPVDPTTNFITTDVPYAIVKVKSLLPGTVVTLRLLDPAGGETSVEVTTPPRKKLWDDFDFALPVYILGTDQEQDTGTWHFRVFFNGTPESDTPFEWHPGSHLALSRIREAVAQSPLTADLHWRYGAALALLGHEREGIQELENAIHLDPRYALYYITLGRVYEREGRQADAIRSFQTALTIQGSYYDAVFSAWAHAHLTHLHAP